MFKVVQHVVTTNVTLKIFCKHHVTRINFLFNNIVLRIVCRRDVYTYQFSVQQYCVKNRR